MLDGKTKGLSGILYKSVHGRERINGFEPSCDKSWLSDNYDLHVNPLNIGQIVNNHPKDQIANLAYEGMNLDPDLPQSVQSLLPNIYYGSYCQKQWIKCVPLVAQ